MSDIAQKNIEILSRRWPTLAKRVLDAQPPEDLQWEGREESPTLSVNGLRLWSAYDSEAEARLQASTMIPGDATLAWVYGIGSGDLVRELLKRKGLQQITVIPLNVGLFHLLLHVLDCTDWLANERVVVEDPTTQKSIHTPLAVIPPCLSLADTELRQLVEHLTQELIRPFEQERQAARLPLRKAHIEANRVFWEKDADVAEVFDSLSGGTAFVCAAGPTLIQTAPWISKNRSSGVLVAVDGALRPLLDLELVPDYVISIDDNPKTIIKYFEGDLSACKKSTLVYSPIVDHQAIARWPGKRLVMYTDEEIYDELREDQPRASLFVGGSVIHPATDLVVRMGSKRILLFGADFGFPDGDVHANAKAPITFYTNAAKARVTVRNGVGYTIPTTDSFNGYRLSLERLIAANPTITFENASNTGALIAGTSHLVIV
jgi:hypothetical protein